MKKRFAMIVAGGLIAVLIAASAALSLGLLGAAPAASGDRAAPRVRTIHHTVTVHRKAKATTPRTIVLAGSGGSSSVSGAGTESESEFEFEGDEGSGGGHGGSEAHDD